MLSNYGAGEDSGESIGLKGDQSQSILKEINPEYSLEGLMLKLKLQYFGHLMRRVGSFKRLWCWERLKAGGEVDDRGSDGWMASATRWTWVWVNSGSWWWTGRPGVLQSVGCQRVGHNWVTELNWTDEMLGRMEEKRNPWYLSQVISLSSPGFLIYILKMLSMVILKS